MVKIRPDNKNENIMGIYKLFADKITGLLDPEIRELGRLIRATAAASLDGGAALKKCDGLFVHRLESYPKALKLSFWENHFEWKALAQYPEISGRILDFGCGTGHSDIFLARNRRAVHGVDISSLGIAVANHLRSQEPDVVRNRLSFSQADVAKDLPAGVLFDSAWASHVFEHIAEPGPVLTGLSRWLKPNGYLLISVPLGHAYDDQDHVNHFSDAGQLSLYLRKYTHIVRIDVCAEFKVLRALCMFKHH